MTTQSSMNFYVNWAKERMDEMNALVTSLEGKAKEMQTDSRGKADQIVADLRKRRDEFQEMVKTQAEAGETAWASNKAQLENIWNGFEAELKSYIDRFGKQIEQQQKIFQDIANAQLKAWSDAAEKVHQTAAGFGADRRGDVEATVNLMKAGASEAEANFQALKRAGAESWTAWSGALAQSRKAFDDANQAVFEAFKRATKAEK